MTINPAFKPLDAAEWQPLTDRERVAHAEEIREAEARGYARGYFDRGAECAQDHSAIANRIDAAARAFYLLDAEEAHRKAVGA